MNTAGYSGVNVTMRVAAFAEAAGEGIEENDDLLVEVSLDGGTNWYDTLRLNGHPDEAFWPYTATGIAQTTYDGPNNTPVLFSPASGGLNPGGYSTIKIDIPGNPTQVRVRVTVSSSHQDERWTIDDVKVNGTGNCATPTPTPSPSPTVVPPTPTPSPITGSNTDTVAVTVTGADRSRHRRRRLHWAA